MDQRIWIALGGLTLAALLGAGCTVTRAGYETAPYRVIEKDGRVELREYPPLRVAGTPRGGDDFMRLFRYISKGNAAGQKIAMTTPVFMLDEGTTNARMAFVLPADLARPPAPANDQVEVRELPPATHAVLRFRGGRQEPDGKAARELRDWMGRRHLSAIGAPRFAYFDPPWIPGFLRRNEVMIPVQAP